MFTFEDIEARRAVIAASADLSGLQDRLTARARPVIERMPPVPPIKALLSRDGGACPDDRSPLLFDPWSPDQHRCPACARVCSGPRHQAHWARFQHLWLAERAAHLATLHVLTGDPGAGARARELLASYYSLYHQLPNRDNVLGPSHLFFSTYLESIWLLDYLAAAFLMREAGALDDAAIGAVDAIADEAARLIAEFNEGLSNRQTWNTAALTAIAVWFGDEDLALTAIEGRTGLLGHLADGFGTDGMWYEGENYHLFALRGWLIGMQWSLLAGADLLADRAAAEHLSQALMAPADTSLPDFTFPARKDARYGVSLAHPAYLECWEAGHTLLGDRAREDLPAWLTTLYAAPVRPAQTYDAYLHDAALPPPAWHSRSELSWWALWMLTPERTSPPAGWTGHTRLMTQQGLGVLRQGSNYHSLECGATGAGAGGHGHPDRLHLTTHANGVHWLPDPGTGSYVSRDLFWYRSTLAHNAPLIDGRDQSPDWHARCQAFASEGAWGWCSAAAKEVRRSIVVGPQWVLDVVEFECADPRRLELPWHINGTIAFDADTTWIASDADGEFVSDVVRLQATGPAPRKFTARADDATLALWCLGDGDLYRAIGPGLPGTGERVPFLIRRTEANRAIFVSVVDTGGVVTDCAWHEHTATITEREGIVTVRVSGVTATIAGHGKRVELGGAQPAPMAPLLPPEQPSRPLGYAAWIDAPPALDGSLTGFQLSPPLTMHGEYHYFRSEDPYPGADVVSAQAHVNWSDDALFVAVDVRTPHLALRAADTAPLELDNEPDDIHVDGVQVYLQAVDHPVRAWLIRPDGPGTISSRAIEPPGDSVRVSGAWTRTDTGYRVTFGLPVPDIVGVRLAGRLRFDLLINLTQPGQVRRVGQLVWSGGPGWVYLRGDRHDPATFGDLELVG